MLFSFYIKKFFLDVLSYEANTSISVICYVFVILIFNNFDLYSLKFKLKKYVPKVRQILLVIAITISLHLTIFFIQIVLSAFYFGETFTINLVTYFRGFNTAIIFILIIPILEEILFRQSILRQLTLVYSKGKSLIVSSVLFALIHYFSDTGLMWAFVAGLVYGLLYLKFNNILLVIFGHILYNALGLYLEPVLNKELYAYNLEQIFQLSIPSLLISLLVFLFFIRRLAIRNYSIAQ